MTIYDPVTTPEGFKRFDNIPDPYYCCGWIIGIDEIRSITKEDEPLIPPTYPNGPLMLDGFAMLESEGYQAFLDEIANRGKTIPE